MSTYLTNASPAYDAFLDDGVTPNPATLVMQAHTGTLDTTGHNGPSNLTIPRGPGAGDDVLLGSDNSAASINPYLDPTLNPASLPAGTVAGPTYTAPIY